MNWGKAVYGFEFEDQLLLDEQIDSDVSDAMAFVVDVQGELSLEGDRAFGEFDAQGRLIHGFEQPRAQSSVDVDGGSDDSARKPVQVSSGLTPQLVGVLAVHPLHSGALKASCWVFSPPSRQGRQELGAGEVPPLLGELGGLVVQSLSGGCL